jgi:hypothetical protein
MDDDSGFITGKLAACIYAALRFPESDPAVVAAWDENQHIVVLRKKPPNRYKSTVFGTAIDQGKFILERIDA